MFPAKLTIAAIGDTTPLLTATAHSKSGVARWIAVAKQKDGRRMTLTVAYADGTFETRRISGC